MKVEKISKKFEQDRQRDERAARRALKAKKREAQMKIDDATKRQIEDAEHETDEMAAKLKNELSMKHIEREIVLAEAKAKAWDEVSLLQSSMLSSTARSSAVSRNQLFIGGGDVNKCASLKLTKEQRVDLNTNKYYPSYLAELNQGPWDWGLKMQSSMRRIELALGRTSRSQWSRVSHMTEKDRRHRIFHFYVQKYKVLMEILCIIKHLFLVFEHIY